MINVQDEYQIEDCEQKPISKISTKKPKHNYKSPILQNQPKNTQNLGSTRKNLEYSTTPEVISKHVNKFKTPGKQMKQIYYYKWMNFYVN